MSTPLTPTQRIAWDAIGHAQEHWTAVQKALAAVGPHHRDATDSADAPRITTNNFTTVALDDDGDEVMTVDLVCMTCLRPVCGMREWTLAGVVAEAEAHVCSADAGQVHRLAEVFPGAVAVEHPASPPQSTEPRRESTPDDPSTPDAVEAATAWLLADHDERVTTGTVRPASERAAELVAAIRAADAATPIPAVDIPAWREMGDHSGG